MRAAAYRGIAPLFAYSVVKAAGTHCLRLPQVEQQHLSIVGRLMLDVPLTFGWRSRVYTYHGKLHFLSERSVTGADGVRRAGKRDCAPTLIKSPSGCYWIRDTFGPRNLVDLEVARLHGYSARSIAAFMRAASNNEVCSAVGDGFVVPCVRDLIAKMLDANADEVGTAGAVL